MRFASVFGIVLLSMLSCSKSSDGTSRIRVENQSDKIFDMVAIWGVEHGSLNPGDLSQYTLVNEMYEKVSVSVAIDTLLFSQIVIDYVGEEPLRPGDFTLQVNIGDLDDPSSISQTLRRD